MARSVVAVVVGFVVAALLAAGGDWIVLRLAPTAFRPEGHPALHWLLLALGYSSLAGFVGGAVAAHLLPGRELRAAMMLGVLLLAFGLAAVSMRPDTAPLWYHALSLTLVVPVVYCGGLWRARPTRDGAAVTAD